MWLQNIGACTFDKGRSDEFFIMQSCEEYDPRRAAGSFEFPSEIKAIDRLHGNIKDYQFRHQVTPCIEEHVAVLKSAAHIEVAKQQPPDTIPTR